MNKKEKIAEIKEAFKDFRKKSTERSRRLWAGEKVEELKNSGEKTAVHLVHKATGLSRSTIYKGRKEFKRGADQESSDGRIRKPGGGRHKIISDKKLANAIQDILNEDYEFNKTQAFSHSVLSINQISKKLIKRDISVSNSRTVHTLQNDISCVVYKNNKNDQHHSLITKKTAI
jgi:hypothetical protein